jgi:predicted metal-binding membrane protein
LTSEHAAASVPRGAQWLALAALLALTALAWGYMVWLAGQMPMPSDAAMANMPGMDMAGMLAPGFIPWTVVHVAFVFAMWSIMMVGMMTPSVAPMVLIYARVTQQSATSGRWLRPVAWFTSGYLLAWTLFAAVATFVQWGLETLALLTPMMTSANRPVGGALLMVAGVYQWLPIKDACLSQCRAPLSFMQRHGGFQARALGSIRLGFLHGLYCVGCCWALMALLFVFGVMNLLWIAALMIYILIEKIVPGSRYLTRLVGGVAIVMGIYFMV